MEMPIQVMIVLFVTIIVATTVIMFTTDVLNTSKQKLNDDWSDEEPDRQVLEVDTITPAAINALIGECWKRYSDRWERTLCYVVHGKDGYDPTQHSNVSGILVESSGEPARTVFIYYNPEGKVEVTS